METTLEIDGDMYAVPDTPHMEIMFDALEHTASWTVLKA